MVIYDHRLWNGFWTLLTFIWAYKNLPFSVLVAVIWWFLSRGVSSVFSAGCLGQVRLIVQLLWKQRPPRHCSLLQGKRCSPDIITVNHRAAVICVFPLLRLLHQRYQMNSDAGFSCCDHSSCSYWTLRAPFLPCCSKTVNEWALLLSDQGSSLRFSSLVIIFLYQRPSKQRNERLFLLTFGRLFLFLSFSFVFQNRAARVRVGKGDRPLTYEQALPPHQIGHRKGWLSQHTSEHDQACLKSNLAAWRRPLHIFYRLSKLCVCNDASDLFLQANTVGRVGEDLNMLKI